MVEGHVSEELLGRFIRVEVSRREAKNVVRHLLSGCARCLEAAHRVATESGLFGSARAAGWERAYEKVFERALAFASEEEQRLALEKLRGWALWEDLRPLTPQRRLSMVESDARFHTFGLYDRLLEAGRWAQYSEPAEAVHIARLAIRVAERLDPDRVGERRRADLRSVAWGAFGNALRVAEDFEGARNAFNEAWKILEEEGSNDSLDRAALLSLEASYIKDIGEFETAESAGAGACTTTLSRPGSCSRTPWPAASRWAISSGASGSTTAATGSLPQGSIRTGRDPAERSSSKRSKAAGFPPRFSRSRRSRLRFAVFCGEPA